MRDMAHSVCLIKLYQITTRKNFDFLFLTTLKTCVKMAKMAHRHTAPVFQVRWIRNLVVISYGSCLPQVCKNSWWRHRYFVSMMSSSFLCIATHKISNFSNFNRIKLKFGLKVDAGALISSQKVDRTSSFDEERHNFFDFSQVQCQ